VIRSDRTWTFAVPRDELWTAITQTGEYRRWWPWLRSFRANGFDEGDVWRCLVQPPVPWWVRFTITLDEVTLGERAVARVGGDIKGTAELTLADDGKGSSARLVSDLAPASLVLQAAAFAARPLAVWGHDWVLDQGAAQFSRRALAAR
jgi:uncharacterized protein YndB with AHSA1/START domain